MSARWAVEQGRPGRASLSFTNFQSSNFEITNSGQLCMRYEKEVPDALHKVLRITTAAGTFTQSLSSKDGLFPSSAEIECPDGTVYMAEESSVAALERCETPNGHSVKPPSTTSGQVSGSGSNAVMFSLEPAPQPSAAMGDRLGAFYCAAP